MSLTASDRAWRLEADGWVSGVVRKDSPNHDARPDGAPARLAIVHAISLPPGEFDGPAIDDFFLNRLDPAAHPYFAMIAGRRVSAHFLIRRNGAVTQYVSCLRRAWHAGVSCWRGRERCNDFSIGIELEGDDHTNFDARQYAALHRLLTLLAQAFPIEEVVGHADVAAGRKTDPGPRFDWSRLRGFIATHPRRPA
jgi:AmpD protein